MEKRTAPKLRGGNRERKGPLMQKLGFQPATAHPRPAAEPNNACQSDLALKG